MSDLNLQSLTEPETRYLAKLRRMFPRREGGAEALEAKLRRQNFEAEQEIRAGTHLSAAVIAHYTARVRRIYGPREMQPALFDLAVQETSQAAGASVAPPDTTEMLPLPETLAQGGMPEAGACEKTFWDTERILEMEFAHDACAIAVTPLEDAEQGKQNWEYVEDATLPPGDPARVKVRVRYTREQMELAMRLARALQEED